MNRFSPPKQININGKTYPSILSASFSTSVPVLRLREWYKEVQKTGKSELEKTFSVPKKFIIKKVKKDEH